MLTLSDPVELSMLCFIVSQTCVVVVCSLCVNCLLNVASPICCVLFYL